jgi:8-oxo-dGTP diphosphatase
MAERIKAKAAAIFLSGKKMLLTKKAACPYWIMPGGIMENGETAEECLSREIREELGCGIKNKGFFGAYLDEIYEKPGKKLVVLAFKAELVGKPRPLNEILEAKYFSFQDVNRYEVASGAVAIFNDLQKRKLV